MSPIEHACIVSVFGNVSILQPSSWREPHGKDYGYPFVAMLYTVEDFINGFPIQSSQIKYKQLLFDSL